MKYELKKEVESYNRESHESTNKMEIYPSEVACDEMDKIREAVMNNQYITDAINWFNTDYMYDAIKAYLDKATSIEVYAKKSRNIVGTISVDVNNLSGKYVLRPATKIYGFDAANIEHKFNFIYTLEDGSIVRKVEYTLLYVIDDL